MSTLLTLPSLLEGHLAEYLSEFTKTYIEEGCAMKVLDQHRKITIGT